MDAVLVVGVTCGNCGGDSVHGSRVRSAFWHGERLVVVDDIPAMVCDDCGEQFYDDATAIGLDLMRGEGFPPERACGELTASVFSFSDRLLEPGVD